jgi:hypothetical protein
MSINDYFDSVLKLSSLNYSKNFCFVFKVNTSHLSKACTQFVSSHSKREEWYLEDVENKLNERLPDGFNINEILTKLTLLPNKLYELYKLLLKLSPGGILVHKIDIYTNSLQLECFINIS